MRVKKLKKNLGRGLAFLLVMLMILGMMPVGALAAELEEENTEEFFGQEAEPETETAIGDLWTAAEETDQIPEETSAELSEDVAETQGEMIGEEPENPQAGLPDEQSEPEQPAGVSAEPEQSAELSADEGEEGDARPEPSDSAGLPAPVVFVCTPETAAVRVFSLPTEGGEEPLEILSPEDGIWYLMPGDYLYSAEAEGFLPLYDLPLTVAVPEDGGVLTVERQ